jgi:hypothetical protein
VAYICFSVANWVLGDTERSVKGKMLPETGNLFPKRTEGKLSSKGTEHAEGAVFGSKRKQQWELERKRMAQRRDEWERDEKRAAKLYERAYHLKDCAQPDLPRMAMALFRDAQHELTLVRQSIRDRTKYEPPRYIGNEKHVGDSATSSGEELADMIRENHTNPQKIFEAMSEQFPKVHFTLDYYDSAALISATIREARLLGIVEGLELAGFDCDDQPKRA